MCADKRLKIANYRLARYVMKYAKVLREQVSAHV